MLTLRQFFKLNVENTNIITSQILSPLDKNSETFITE